MTDVQALLDEYRGVRDALERAVLPLATSVDGRRFRFQTTLQSLELEPAATAIRTEPASAVPSDAPRLVAVFRRPQGSARPAA